MYLFVNFNSTRRGLNDLLSLICPLCKQPVPSFIKLPRVNCWSPPGRRVGLGWCAPTVPVGGPACGVAGERRAVPAASAADISALFIKSMTTLSSPISGPSCTGVLLLLSGRVSSILLPCYSLELLMANTIPPFSAWPLPPRSRWNQAWRSGSWEIGVGWARRR